MALGGESHVRSAVEIQQLMRLDEAGEPYLVLHDAAGAQHLFVLDDREKVFTMGRHERCDVAIPWDAAASKLHAELLSRSGMWLLQDDGLSRNGTRVNGTRIQRRVLRDDDVIEIGTTRLRFHEPSRATGVPTFLMSSGTSPPQLAPAARRVLAVLCRGPVMTTGPAVGTPTNQEIAAELGIKAQTVKAQIRNLCRELDIEGNGHKRAELVEVALREGFITAQEVHAAAQRALR